MSYRRISDSEYRDWTGPDDEDCEARSAASERWDVLSPYVESIIEKAGELSLGPLPDDVAEVVGCLQADAEMFRYEFDRLIEADRG